jgi:Ca-activated chloride channel homolog
MIWNSSTSSPKGDQPAGRGTRILSAVLVVAAATLAGPAGAQGLLVAQPPPANNRIIPRPVPRPLPIRAQKVALTVNSGAVKADVSQVFQNSTSTPLEGTYLFNLPPGAAVANFRMQVDKEPVDGKMLNVEEARRIYEQFVRQQVDPGILEYAGNNAFRARVFPIPGNSDKEIQIGYSHPASFQNGLYQITYPLNTEKASPEPLRELSIRCALRPASQSRRSTARHTRSRSSARATTPRR